MAHNCFVPGVLLHVCGQLKSADVLYISRNKILFTSLDNLYLFSLCRVLSWFDIQSVLYEIIILRLFASVCGGDQITSYLILFFGG